MGVVGTVAKEHANAGVNSTSPQTQIRYNPLISTSVRINNTEDIRIWFALTNNSKDTDFIDGTLSNATVSLAGLRYSHFLSPASNQGFANDTNWQCVSKSATTGTNISTNIQLLNNTQFNLTVYATPNQVCCEVNDVNVCTTSTLPDPTTNMFIHNMVSNGTTGSCSATGKCGGGPYVKYFISKVYFEDN